jgi:putative flippase GtrA
LLRQFISYAGIGAIGTAAHYAVLLCLVELLAIDPVVGSTLGFVVGAIVNYLLNYTYTFRSSARHLPTFVRFFSVALVGGIINLAIMELLVYTASLHYFLSQIVATAIVVVVTFLLNRAWTFKIKHYVER